MQNLTKQTVYLPVNGETEFIVAEYGNGAYIEGIEGQEGYFFTPVQLNQLLSGVIKDTLNTAAENAELDYWRGSCRECGSNKIDEQSITNTFDITYAKFSVK